jgi:hypothetical protein
MSPTTRVYRNPDLIAADMDGDTVMMSFERGTYFGLGGVGPRVWTLLENPTSIAAIVTTICAEYDVDEQTCTEDIQRFIAKMIENQIVISD